MDMVGNIGSNSEIEGLNYSFAGGDGEDGVIKEQDRLLPIANVGRIMKRSLPANAKISKEAKETMQECVSEFISFVTGEASDKCHKEKRKTVNGDDICWALGSLGFDDYAKPLKRYLNRYRELEGERANQNKASTSEEKDETTVLSYRGEPPTSRKPSASSTNSFKFTIINETKNSFSRGYIN
ncbi:nuclear transcription factor Y subunit B-4-like [Diospyros lotus]|uniref:nuclear transcription factor Y subunit B-4-like n=1 Tax=Diospyros lotus TaxID=55363 RepID=UPI00225B9F9C|nr:nuclear transcription factor Y subunit B-4-like [Diospyros lotus]